MLSHAILPPMHSVRWSVVVVVLIAAAACGSDEPQGPAPKESRGDESGVPGATVPDPRSSDVAAPLGSGPGDPRVPVWPREFRVTSAERVGTREDSLLAYSLETTQLAPEAAVKLLADAISLVAAGTPRIGIAAETGGECVGQVHASDLAATLKAERRGPTTLVQLLLAKPRSSSR